MKAATPTATMLSIISLSLLPLIAAHGRMTWPRPRLLPGDDNNGYTYARTASVDPCQSLPEGPVLTPALVGGTARIDYVITAPHKGGCTIFLDKRDGSGWVSIGSDPTCGMLEHSGTINVDIPPGDYSAVLRWYYESDNYSGELFNNCADIIVSTTDGTNQHASASADNFFAPALSSNILVSSALFPSSSTSDGDGDTLSTTYTKLGESPLSTPSLNGILSSTMTFSVPLFDQEKDSNNSCQVIGAMRCVDSNPSIFQICAPGDNWVTMNCPAPNDLQCTYTGSDSVVCGWKPKRR